MKTIALSEIWSLFPPLVGMHENNAFDHLTLQGSGHWEHPGITCSLLETQDCSGFQWNPSCLAEWRDSCNSV